jgi:hypothetical protein
MKSQNKAMLTEALPGILDFKHKPFTKDGQEYWGVFADERLLVIAGERNETSHLLADLICRLFRETLEKD